MDELREWASSAQFKSWERRANRGSLSQDLAAATDQLGDNLRRRTLGEADALLELVRMATVTRPTRQTLGKIFDCADSLKHKLDHRDSIGAAWRDVIASSRGSDVQVLDNQLLILEDLIERSAGQSRWVFLNVASAISGSDQFGRFFSPDTSKMSLPERLELAEDLLAGEEQVGECVAWMSYGSARLDGQAQYGPVSFYEVDWAVPNALGNPGQEFPHREELREILEADPDLWEASPTGRRYQVLARVELGSRASYKALAHAGRLVDFLVAAATRRAGGAKWRRSGSSVLLVDGAIASGAFDKYREDEDIDHLGQNATAHALFGHGPAIGQALESKTMPPYLLEGLRLLTEASAPEAREALLSDCAKIDARSAIVLEDSAFNQFVAFAAVKKEDLDGEIRARWPVDVWRVQLENSVQICLSHGEGKARDLWLRLEQTARKGFEAWLAEVHQARGELLQSCGDRLERASAAPLLESIGSAEAFLGLRQSFDDAGELVAQRLARVRNALAHGSPVTPMVLASVREYSRYRTETAWALALAEFVDERSVGTAIAEAVKRREESIEALRNGRAPLGVANAIAGS